VVWVVLLTAIKLKLHVFKIQFKIQINIQVNIQFNIQFNIQYLKIN
jgi:hypothetical protein